MATLYQCEINHTPCAIVEKDFSSYVCTIGTKEYGIAHGFTEEDKRLDFLMQCIVDAHYKQHIAQERLEGICFD